MQACNFAAMDAPRSVPVYEKPPLVEAVLAFTFARYTVPWDSIYFGKFHDRVQRDFPMVGNIPGASIEMSGETRVRVHAAPEIKRFARHDEGMVMTVGANLLGLSVLPKKYPGGHPGWPTLLHTALASLQSYVTVTKPDEIVQVGVRYINAIPIDPATFLLRTIIADDATIIPAALLEERNPFSLRVERTRGTASTRRLQEALALQARPSPHGSAELVLDVDELSLGSVDSSDQDRLSEVAGELHDAVHGVFSTVIRDDVRDSFLPKPPSPMVK